MKTRTLDERVFGRVNTPDRRSVKDKVRYRFGTPQYHVRAELQRVARQIRKKKVKSATTYSEEWYYNAGIDDAIELIREATR